MLMIEDNYRIEAFKLVLELHEIGIAHCDLGPENFLRCDDGTFKIIDFTQGRFHECKGIRDVSILCFCNSPSCNLYS